MSGGANPGPLAGMTVLAVEQYGAGPFGTMLLADLGADVIKIETVGESGDVGRSVGPYHFGPGDSHFYQSFNRNKRSITLNIKDPAGREILHQLVAGADAVLDNLRGDLPARLGLTYADLAPHNAAIVCAHLSAYGRTGSRASWPGYDYLMQAEAGYLALTGEPDAPPSRFGLSIVDMMTGLMTVFALASGVIGARRTGRGMDVDVSLFDTALHNLSYLATWYLNAGHNQGREARSGHPSLVPSQLYPTQDGWIFIMCNKEKFWPILARALGHPEWADDPRFASFKDRLANKDALNALLDDAFRRQTTQHWLDAFAGEVPAAPVLDVQGALESRFVQENGNVAECKREGVPEHFEMLAGPIRVNGERTAVRTAPALGADTVDILTGLGYSLDEIGQLRAGGSI